MNTTLDLVAPCGLYCGVCTVYIAHRDQNQKKVILRAIPYWREVGTKKWIQDEENRYICPECGNTLFRGVVTCNRCKTELDLD